MDKQQEENNFEEVVDEQQPPTQEEQQLEEQLEHAKHELDRAFWLTIWDKTKFPLGLLAGLLLGRWLSR